MSKKSKKEKKSKETQEELYVELVEDVNNPDEGSESEEMTPEESETEASSEKPSSEDNQEEIDESEEESDDEKPEEEQKVDLFKKHIEREAILDQIFDDNGYKKKDEIKEDREKVPYKGAGIFTLILAILGLLLIGAMVYFIILNPYYIKDGEAEKNLVYPELASDTNATELSTLLEPYGASETDAETEIEE